MLMTFWVLHRTPPGTLSLADSEVEIRSWERRVRVELIPLFLTSWSKIFFLFSRVNIRVCAVPASVWFRQVMVMTVVLPIKTVYQ